jgi:hypothetical protein
VAISRTSNPPLPKLLLKIDDLTRRDHYYLEEGDQCYYLGEYTAGAGHAYSETNQLILNFKKSMDKRGTSQWQYKVRAIERVAAMLRAAVKPDAKITFVPIPPSAARDDPKYDDRMSRALEQACDGRPSDFRELVVQAESVQPAHLSAHRPTPDEIAANYRIDESLSTPEPEVIFIVDDVLTTGSHFKAMQKVLLKQFPNARIVGLFVARRAPKSVEADFEPIADA